MDSSIHIGLKDLCSKVVVVHEEALWHDVRMTVDCLLVVTL